MPERYWEWENYVSDELGGLAANAAFGRWERPWRDHPPEGTWALCIWQCPARNRHVECTVEAIVDVLRGMIDTGQLEPEDVVRDIVLHNGRWRVRGWRRGR